MEECKRLKLAELNPHLICVLCGGYLVDATSIVECLHSFCRTCIIHYLHTSNYCPVCEVLVHKKRPLEHIQPDTILQDIVYKTVPGLFKEEMRRRREFYENHKNTENATNLSENIPEVGSRVVFSSDEMISLCLQFSSRTNQEEESVEKFEDTRYLLCPAGVSIYHIKKFIKSKFSLPDNIGIDCFGGDELLNDDYTLVDVAYITQWKRDKVMQISYTFYGNPVERCRTSQSNIELPLASDETCSNSCVSSVINNGSDDECFEDSGCEVNDSQISHDESALSDIVDQSENICGVDMTLKTLQRLSSVEEKLTLKRSNSNMKPADSKSQEDKMLSSEASNETNKNTDEPTTDKCKTDSSNSNNSSEANDAIKKSYMTSFVSFLGQREKFSNTPMRLPLRSPTATSTPVVEKSSNDLDDSGNVADVSDKSVSFPSPNSQNNNYMILPNDKNVQDKPLTLKIRKPSCDIENSKSECVHTGSSSAHDKGSKCVGVCNGHSVKSNKSDKLLLRLSRDGDSNTYTASMS